MAKTEQFTLCFKEGQEMFNFTNDSLDKATILKLESQFPGLALFSSAAERAFLQSAKLLTKGETKDQEETAISLLCQRRYQSLMPQLKNRHYFDLRNLDPLNVSQKTTFTGQSIQDCQQFTEPTKRKGTLTFKEQDVYSLAAHISPPTKLKPNIQEFLDDCRIQYNLYTLQDLNIQLTEKLKAIQIDEHAICHKKWGHLSSKIAVDKMAPHVIDCIIKLINENFEKRNLSPVRQTWIDAFITSTTGTLTRFKKLRDNAEGQSTFNILCVLHASLSAYIQAPLTQAEGEEYILDTPLMQNILDTISFSASIAKELALYQGDYTRIQELVKTKIIAKVNQPNTPVILPVCTPIPPDETRSEHAFYIVLKKVSDQQYKISIVNCGYASKHGGLVVDFKEILDTEKTINYLSDAFNVEFFQLDDDETLDEDELIDKHLKGNIYDEKAYGELVVSNSTVTDQFYGNCTLHNYNFAIKHCFELGTLNFSKFRQMNLAGFDKFIENNKLLLSQANAAAPSTQTTTTTAAATTSSTVAITRIPTEKEKNERSLRQAAMEGNETVLRSLLEQKVDVNCRGEQSQKTALHFAAANNHLGCVKILLKAGALQTPDSSGNLPKDYANRKIRQALQGKAKASSKAHAF